MSVLKLHSPAQPPCVVGVMVRAYNNQTLTGNGNQWQPVAKQARVSSSHNAYPACHDDACAPANTESCSASNVRDLLM